MPGFGVIVWTVNDPREARRIADLGAFATLHRRSATPLGNRPDHVTHAARGLVLRVPDSLLDTGSAWWTLPARGSASSSRVLCGVHAAAACGELGMTE